MKIYISLPLAGHENTAYSRYREAVKFLEKFYEYDKYIEVVGPINIDEFKENVGLEHNRDHDWAWYMGKDVEELLRCDAILMCKGWKQSRGCRCEHGIATADGKIVIYYPDADSSLF